MILVMCHVIFSFAKNINILFYIFDQRMFDFSESENNTFYGTEGIFHFPSWVGIWVPTERVKIRSFSRAACGPNLYSCMIL
jgi:hypothetical protein